jgi:NAD(P)-dependent dehydrogenase (short-subunit alcohol dehydrogenase family)
MDSFAGAGVVVTGAGSGIGAALARRFVAEGAIVVLNDLNAAAVRSVAESCSATAAGGTAGGGTAGGGRAVAIPGDAASEDGVAELIGSARSELGEIDLFCANAGVARRGGPEASEEDWADSWNVNVMAHVRAARLLLPRWLQRGSGHLICTVSAAGLLATPGSAPYSVTKHGALAFAEWLSLTHRHRGLTVQAICPMGVRTGMFDGSEPRMEKLLGPDAIMPDDVADAVMAAVADGRFLILPHPDVARMYAGRAADPDRWLAGLNLIQQDLEAVQDTGA